MAYFELSHIKVAAVASAVPTEVVKLEEFADKFGADYVEKYKEQTGVKQFRKTREHQTASDLAFAAAENIINSKGIDRESIGVLAFIAHSTDYWRPATACVLHKRLGLKKDCAAFDVSLACSAVPYGMYVVGSMMETSDVERALLLVGETPQKITNPDDKSSCMLIGEGGGAFLLEKTDEEGAGISGICRSFGQGYNAIIMPGGGFRNPNPLTEEYVWKDGNRRSMYNVMMRGEDVFALPFQMCLRQSRSTWQKRGKQPKNSIVWLSIKPIDLYFRCFVRNLKWILKKCQCVLIVSVTRLPHPYQWCLVMPMERIMRQKR